MIGEWQRPTTYGFLIVLHPSLLSGVEGTKKQQQGVFPGDFCKVTVKSGICALKISESNPNRRTAFARRVNMGSDYLQEQKAKGTVYLDLNSMKNVLNIALKVFGVGK